MSGPWCRSSGLVDGFTIKGSERVMVKNRLMVWKRMAMAAALGLVAVAGCKSNTEPAKPPVSVDGTAPAVVNPGHLMLRSDGAPVLLNADATQGLVMTKDGFFICDLTGATPKCSELKPFGAAAPGFEATPCPCTDPLCKKGCGTELVPGR